MKFFAQILATLALFTSGQFITKGIADETNKPSIESYLTDHKDVSKDTRRFYKENDYVPVWFPKGDESVAAKTAEDVLKNSSQDGLDPKDYKQTWATDYKQDPIGAEVALTEAFLKYIKDIRVGRIPAKDAARSIKLTSPKTHPVKLLTLALKDSDDKFKTLTQMAPDLPEYTQLKGLLKTYRELAVKWQKLPTIKKTKVKLGQTDQNIPDLKKILTAYGYYSGSNFDDTYSQSVFDSVVDFQRHNNLEADGIIGEDTARSLNMSIKKRIQKIIINMERLRWFPDDMGKKYIIVNVGGYEVWAMQNNKIEIRMRAIVGQVGRKTPLFYAPLKNIIINPSWGVPKSILIRDKIPKIINDPSYLERAGFTVYDNSGHKVDPDQVDWESHGSSMHLRQSPGFRNALGRIKFNIENPYTIYLHGTPTGNLFDKSRRNFSSGCIRLQDPKELAAWVLKDENGWDQKKIQKEINTGKTVVAPMKSKIPVYFTYQTVWISDDGKPHFSPDAYKMDDNLIRLLNLDDQSVMELARSRYPVRYG